jgi:hypothetical protein
MSDAIFITNKSSGLLTIGDKREIDRASWHKPRGMQLTPTSRYIRNRLFQSDQKGRKRLPFATPGQCRLRQ